MVVKTDSENRIELESQILCSALRHSWAESDVDGLVKAYQQLDQIFPDLLSLPEEGDDEQPANLYELLQIDYYVNPPRILAAYLKTLKRFLRANKNPRRKRKEFYKILNAGMILRAPRLRLSHDLTVARSWIVNQQVVGKNNPLELSATPAMQMPFIVEILKLAQFIGQAEIQALSNQMSRYPEIPVTDLVLRAGYVTEFQLQSLQEAEQLLQQGVITMSQFLNSQKLHDLKKSNSAF